MQKATFYKHDGQTSASRWDTSRYIKRKSYGGTAHTFRRQACPAVGTPICHNRPMVVRRSLFSRQIIPTLSCPSLPAG